MSNVEVFDRLAARLTAAGLPAEHYTLPAFAGYSSITGLAAADVHCIEAYLGPAHGKPDHAAYAMAQTFHPHYPSLSLIMLIERRLSDQRPSNDLSVYNVAIDFKFSTIFIPIMYSALNELDPIGQNRGQLVQAYHSKLTLGDLIQASKMSLDLVLTFKREGQLANIAVDFDDPLIKIIAGGLRPILGVIGDIHWLVRTKTPSMLNIPVRNPHGDCYLIGNHSTALDKGIRVAYDYLDKYYRRATSQKNIKAV